MEIDAYHELAFKLIRELISIPSVSRKEKQVANRLTDFLVGRGHKPYRRYNNVWVRHQVSDDLPTILLNSHTDTVKPVGGWTKDPWSPEMEEFRIYGLGSNDAGGPLVSLLMTFLYYSEKKDLPFNLVFAATAEEEISGEKGVISILKNLGKIDL